MKYPPRKVFVLEDGMYVELSYVQFNQRKECYAGRRFIPLYGMRWKCLRVTIKRSTRTNAARNIWTSALQRTAIFPTICSPRMSSMARIFWLTWHPIRLVTQKRKSCWTTSGLNSPNCLKMSRKSCISSMANGLANELSQSAFMCLRTPSTGVKSEFCQSYGKPKN